MIIAVGLFERIGMKQEFYDVFADCPVIPAVKDEEGLEEVLKSDLQVVFVLYGDVCNISSIVERLKAAGKLVVVHLDLVGGLSAKEIAVDYIVKQTRADGIISTKVNVCQRAFELGILSIYRVFLLDSRAIESARKQAQSLNADIVEILPGAMPKVTKLMGKIFKRPIIAGGLIRDKEDVTDALDAGALCISTTNREVWKM